VAADLEVKGQRPRACPKLVEGRPLHAQTDFSRSGEPKGLACGWKVPDRSRAGSASRSEGDESNLLVWKRAENPWFYP